MCVAKCIPPQPGLNVSHLSYMLLHSACLTLHCTHYTAYGEDQHCKQARGMCCIVLHMCLVRVTFPLIYSATTHVNGSRSEPADFLSIAVGYYYSNARGHIHTDIECDIDRDIECEGKACLLYPLHVCNASTGLVTHSTLMCSYVQIILVSPIHFAMVTT